MVSNFFPRVLPFMRECGKKYGSARQSVDYNIIRRMRYSCWSNKARDTKSEYAILIAAMVKANETRGYVNSYIACPVLCSPPPQLLCLQIFKGAK